MEERRARGRALREKTPRTSHAFWAEAPNRLDPIALLEAQATARLPDNDQAITSFAEAYANQTERDYQALLSAIKSGRLVAAVAG